MGAGVQFDYILDIDDGFKPLQSALGEKDTTTTALMTRGWESCTHGGVPSIYNGALNTPHHSPGNASFWTQQLCSAEILEEVKRKYANDFALFQKNFPEKVVGCSPGSSHVGVCS